HRSSGPVRKAMLLKNITLSKMSEGGNVRDHISEFFQVRLEKIGLQINEDLLAILLLYSLSESCKNFRVSMESRDELPKPEKIKILEEAESRK
ncbi:hypothetical protein EAG_13047, partial [Camponotus floridanus]